MLSQSIKSRRITLVHEGLCAGLSQYSGPSRAALIFAEKQGDPMRIHDPQNLLEGHEPKLKELYLDSHDWREKAPSTEDLKFFGQIIHEKNLQLAGLISYGGRTSSIFYQMWFTEHHPNMCSVGPTERWLEQAVCLLSHDFVTEENYYTGASQYVLREYVTHAVRDYIMDEINLRIGWDTQVAVFPILEAILGISKTLEEGAWPRGKLAFLMPEVSRRLDFLIRFPRLQRPLLKNFKHARKLLQAVENSERALVSDGLNIRGIVAESPPDFNLTADFYGAHGFLILGGEPVCSFADGRFYSTTREPVLVQLEEALIEIGFDPSDGATLFQVVSSIVKKAAEQRHGCTLVLDFNEQPVSISGQTLERPLDLNELPYLQLAQSLAKVDGALHIDSQAHLRGFACLLDGRSVPGEDRARGARFNSALRFTSEHKNLIVVVVSSDRPVSVIQGGVELTAACDWKAIQQKSVLPPTLEAWLER